MLHGDLISGGGLVQRPPTMDDPMTNYRPEMHTICWDTPDTFEFVDLLFFMKYLFGDAAPYCLADQKNSKRTIANHIAGSGLKIEEVYRSRADNSRWIRSDVFDSIIIMGFSGSKSNWRTQKRKNYLLSRYPSMPIPGIYCFI